MPYPQRGRTQLYQLIAAYIRDNALNQITPSDIRRVLKEIVSSDWNRADDGTNNGGGGGGGSAQLADFITLDEAGAMQGAPSPVDGAQPGVLYVIAGSSLKQWNGGNTSEVVFVEGLVNAFASTGWVVDGNGTVQAVAVDITAGAYVVTGTGAPPNTTYRDPLAIGDNTAVTAAVLDASNTWVNGDLTAYGSPALANAGAPAAVTGQHSSILVGTADVQNGDQFDGTNAGGSAYRHFYGRRNDGTSGWTRIAKL